MAVSLTEIAKRIDNIGLRVELAKIGFFGRYDESKHPRDAHGRWSTASGARISTGMLGNQAMLEVTGADDRLSRRLMIEADARGLHHAFSDDHHIITGEHSKIDSLRDYLRGPAGKHL